MKSDIQTLLNRGTVEVIVRKDLEEKLKSGKKLRVKLGIDPSGADLHIGHMVVIKKLREFQEAGHEIQLLFGNFTGQIGDPTDKLNARKPKTQSELETNAAKYLEQAGKILDTKKAKIVWNADWLKKLTFADVIKLAQCFTVPQMMHRDMYQERIKNNADIYIHEFLYPLMQGYDSVALKSDLELGGTDQTFNLLAGRVIQKDYGQIPQNILTVPLLIGTDGENKMGKSLDNYIGVTENPKEMYGKTMSVPDELIMSYFELATDVSLQDIAKLRQAMEQGENPRNLKMRLAHELVTLYHDKKSAEQAEAEFVEIFTNKGLPKNIPAQKFSKNKINIVELLAESKLVASKGEARRLIEGGGVRIDGNKVASHEENIDLSQEKLLQVGKRKFLKVHGNAK
ncbi:tyrosine--tRNA ligase [Candidatus Peregrinibacteria bacterium]|nr:tyrosine--tRNA ligase [Candidatus Peregrinibacteria bacterium]